MTAPAGFDGAHGVSSMWTRPDERSRRERRRLATSSRPPEPNGMRVFVFGLARPAAGLRRLTRGRRQFAAYTAALAREFPRSETSSSGTSRT